jgi:hypothetical protein
MKTEEDMCHTKHTSGRRNIYLFILVASMIQLLAACGTGANFTPFSLDPSEVQERSNISGQYKFISGDCGISDDMTIMQTDDAVEITQGVNSYKGVWSLSPGGNTVLSYGDDQICLGVFNSPNLFASCHSGDKSCTMKLERTLLFKFLPAPNANAAAVPSSDISGELLLVSTNCPFPEAVPGTLIVNQSGSDLEIRTWLYLSFAGSISAHGDKSSIGYLTIDDNTPCYCLIGDKKVDVICTHNDLSCGIQYAYKYR